MTAHNYRTIRAHLIENGVADPMELLTLHSLLDVAEGIIIASKVSGCKTRAEAEAAVSSFNNQLYAPEKLGINGDGYVPTPEGFSEEDQAASFDAFLGQLGRDN